MSNALCDTLQKSIWGDTISFHAYCDYLHDIGNDADAIFLRWCLQVGVKFNSNGVVSCDESIWYTIYSRLCRILDVYDTDPKFNLYNYASLRPIRLKRNKVTIADLIGKVIVKWVIVESDNDKIELHFHTGDGKHYKFYHFQDCCEYVYLYDIVGDLNDLIGSNLTMAEEVVNRSNSGDDSETWTFYKFATVKGYVTIRWFGSSNGYYSESVDFEEVTHD